MDDEQLDFLFPAGAAAEQAEQAEQLARVTSRIGLTIIAFCRIVWGSESRSFHASDLHEFVEVRAQIAPASADRVLRELRKQGHLDYEVLNRRASLYRLNAIQESTS